MNNKKEEVSFFNTPLEIGTRISMLLSCINPVELDLEQIIFLDYVLVYSKEFSGPGNLHPVVPNHVAEIAYRRTLIPESLELFISRGLLSKKISKKGLYYTSNEETLQFIGCLKSVYYNEMWINLFWIEENFKTLDKGKFKVLSRIRKL